MCELLQKERFCAHSQTEICRVTKIKTKQIFGVKTGKRFAEKNKLKSNDGKP